MTIDPLADETAQLPGSTKLFEARIGQQDADDAFDLATLSSWYLYKGVHAALATISTTNELNFVHNHVLQAGKTYWVGASPNINPGNWTWLTGREAGSILPTFITDTLGPNTNNWGCLTISKDGFAYADCESQQNSLLSWQCPTPNHYFGQARCEGWQNFASEFRVG